MIFHHALELDARAQHDAETRTFEFVASSGAPVQTRAGAEYLRVSGMGLDRFRKNPVVLDSHNRGSSDDVIGVAAVRKEGSQLIASIRFAKDEKSDRIYRKIKDGILRAVSIGFTVDPTAVRELKDGDVDGDGPDEIRGPGVVLNRSELHEISVVPVPADEDALRREFYQRCLMTEETPAAPVDETLVVEFAEQAEDVLEHAAAPAKPAAKQKEIPCDRKDDADEDDKDADGKPKKKKKKGNPVDSMPSGASMVGNTGKESSLDAERAKAMAANTALIRARTEQRDAAQAEIRAICPEDLQPILRALFLEDPDMTFESARRALLAERNRTHVPVGTPEPAPLHTSAPKPLDLGDLHKSLTGR